MIPIARCWAPVQRRWRYIVAGDVIVVPEDDGPGSLMTVVDVRFRQAGILVDYLTYGQVQQEPDVDPDELVTVLVPAVERDGMALLTDTMGARVIGAPEAAEDVA